MRTIIKKPLNMSEQVVASELARVFNEQFQGSENTVVCVGASEPFYVPENTPAAFSCGSVISPESYARIFSRDDYPSSVLHEAAHWCIAGKKRRALLDYGYWYEPDGRDADTQAEFELVEVKPQALERIMSCAAGMKFRLSADNANDPECLPSKAFVDAVHQQTLFYIEHGLPVRALAFVKALDARFTRDRRYAKLCSYVASDLL